MFRKFRDFISMVQELRRLPQVTISMCGDPDCQRHYRYFNRLHRRYFFIRNKSWGVALIQLPDSFDDYLKGKEKQALRTNRNHALRDGFRFDTFTPSDYVKDILEVNMSAPQRQGRPMDDGYLEEHKVVAWANSLQQIFGVFNKDGRLRAYAKVPVCGEIAIFARLLGHYDDLEKGVMYLLISEVVKKCVEMKHKNGNPKWLMYDTLGGRSDGIRYFKERLGFKPYRVKWRWSNSESHK